LLRFKRWSDGILKISYTRSGTKPPPPPCKNSAR
jgi:hypothetical protein